MTVFFFALAFFGVTFVGLSVGLLFKRPGLKGHCGGHQGLDEKLACTSCDCNGSHASRDESVKAVTLLS